MQTNKFRFLIGLITLPCFLSCNEKETDIAVSSIVVSPSSSEMFIGETLQLAAQIVPDNATDQKITWTSTDESIATVSESGVVTAAAEGQCMIQANGSGGVSGTCSITVNTPGDDNLFYLFDITENSQVLIKDAQTMIWVDLYDNGIPQSETFVSGTDTLSVIFSPLGFPQIITNGEEAIILGGYNGHTVKGGIWADDELLDTFELDTEVDWDEYYQTILTFSPTKTRITVEDEKRARRSFEDWIVFKVLEQLVNHFSEHPVNSTLSIADDIIYLAKLYSPLLSDNETWIFYSDAITDAFSYSIQVFTLITSPEYQLLCWNYQKWRYGVIEPILENMKNGTLGKADITYYYKIINGASLSATEAYYDWLGGELNVHLNLGLANFDLSKLEWEIVEKPSWVTYVDKSKEPPYSFKATILKNESTTKREGVIKVSLVNVYNIEETLDLKVYQDTPMTVSPEKLLFTDKEPKEIYVHSTDSWRIVDPPEWCQLDVSGLSLDVDRKVVVTPVEDGKPYHLGTITFEATTNPTDGSEPWTYLEYVVVEMRFYDPYQYLRDKLVKFYYDTDGDHWINNENWCSDLPVVQWFGISENYGHPGKYDINLQNNNLNGSGSLAMCPLAEVHLDGNNLSALDFSDCEDLYELTALSSNLQSINVAGCNELNKLVVENNRLGSLNVSGLKSLNTLYCNFNNLSSLNVQGCFNLGTLTCSGNGNLTGLDVSHCAYLYALYCDDTGLLSLSLPNDCPLTYFSIMRTPLKKEIPPLFDRIRFLQYEQRYINYGKDENGDLTYTDRGFGWYYPGEPDKGYHGW